LAAILRWSAALTCAVALQAAVHAAAPPRLLDLDGRAVDPFVHAAGVRVSVFVFVSVDCPVSNRYAPEVMRLHDRFGKQGVELVLVYPNPADAPAKIREHMNAFSYPLRALRDPQHALVKVAGAKVTPEAAVYNARGALTYRGRIDDRYASIGVERPSPTRHDLADAIAATLAGTPVAAAHTDAVGCFIADFVP
jgi:hypothetical protein